MNYSAENNQRVALASALVMLLCLAVVLAQTTWRFVVDDSMTVSISNNAKPATQRRNTTAANSPLRQLQNQLRSFNPWHAPLAVSNSVDIALSEAEVSKLDITLKGTMVISATEAWAIVLEGKDKQQKVLQEGDIIAGATVEKITRKTLFLKNGDRLEMLAMADDKLESIRGGGKGSAGAAQQQQRRSSVFTVARGDYSDLVKKGMGLLKGVGINPYMQGDKSVGYQIKLPENSIFAEYGLKSQDVVETVNGVPVTQSAKLGGLLRNLKQQETLEVEILRNGEPRKVVVNIN